RFVGRVEILEAVMLLAVDPIDDAPGDVFAWYCRDRFARIIRVVIGHGSELDLLHPVAIGAVTIAIQTGLAARYRLNTGRRLVDLPEEHVGARIELIQARLRRIDADHDAERIKVRLIVIRGNVL